MTLTHWMPGRTATLFLYVSCLDSVSSRRQPSSLRVCCRLSFFSRATVGLARRLLARARAPRLVWCALSRARPT